MLLNWWVYVGWQSLICKDFFTEASFYFCFPLFLVEEYTCVCVCVFICALVFCSFSLGGVGEYTHTKEAIEWFGVCHISIITFMVLSNSLIFEKFSSGDPDTKDNSVGIQLLGIVLANNLPPFDLKCEIDRVRWEMQLFEGQIFLKA